MLSRIWDSKGKIFLNSNKLIDMWPVHGTQTDREFSAERLTPVNGLKDWNDVLKIMTEMPKENRSKKR
jgi:hypothetical protein